MAGQQSKIETRSWTDPIKREAAGGNGTPFEFYKEGYGIEEISVLHHEVVQSIFFKPTKKHEYEEPERTVFGVEPEPEPDRKLEPIKIKWPKEYVTKVTGTHKGGFVETLVFYTNQNPSGYHIGDVNDGSTPFEFGEKDHVIVGFHGRINMQQIAALGVYIKPKEDVFFDNSLGWKKHEAYGGYGGKEFEFVKNGTAITGFTIAYGSVIDSIIFKRADSNGKTSSSLKFGGNGGGAPEEYTFDPNEYLVKVSGTLRTMSSTNAVGSITFQTNLKTYGPFGSEVGTPFKFAEKNRVIVGFHGRAGDVLEAIGFYTKEVKARAPEIKSWGGKAGAPWNEGPHPEIKQIDFYIKNEILRGIQVYYQRENHFKDGEKLLIEGELHGGKNNKTEDGKDDEKNGEKSYTIKLDEGEEYLEGISGFYEAIKENFGNDTIRSLSLYSNKAKYGPFGKELGTFFDSGVGKVKGFHGRSGSYLDAIGVHLEL